ncbi:MAG TPA: HD-GYP domain-containing protein [Bryobacteraceae bacterium]|nr:HD-GYP domain-containing protein [Bryobacteraceae bacterium]
MRYLYRTFLWSIVPFAILLVGTFWTVEKSVTATVREGLRASLRENQAAAAAMQRRTQVQSTRSLRVVAESAALKAGLQLLLANTSSKDARQTVEDQLQEIGEAIGVDLLLVSTIEGAPMVGVIRIEDKLTALDTDRLKKPIGELFLRDGRAFRVTSIPVSQAEDDIATLSVGEPLNLAHFNAPVALLDNGKVVVSNLTGHSLEQIESNVRACNPQSECELVIGSETYLSMVVGKFSSDSPYTLRSFRSVNHALSPIHTVLRQNFSNFGFCALFAAVVVSAISARSIVRPIAQVISQLRQSGTSGLLPELNTTRSSVKEIHELAASFNEAAVAVRQGRDDLNRAYVEFIGSLASALDARDPYTAGHSIRVSEYSCLIAGHLHLAPAEVDELRIGALLHDVGKIGIADSVLQKPGKLSDEEFQLIKEHPVIGRKILEGVNGLAPYLPTVELHHENWDGTGYPNGLKGEQVPLAARIVHVADAYDAMTSDRPYRRGMSAAHALNVLKANAGTQFDPLLVTTFATCVENGATEAPIADPSTYQNSLRKLALAVRTGSPRTVEQLVSGNKS